MHPILSKKEHVALYFAVAGIVAAIPATALALSSDISITKAFLLSLPPTIVFALFGLTAWFPCRALPIARAAASRIVGAHLLGAAVAAALWLVLWRAWLARLSVTWFDAPTEPNLKLLFSIGAILYLFTVVVHYLMQAAEASREAEQAALKFQVLAREAELRAFKAQIDPHFLFNSLNSISSLTSSSPSDARTMTQQLADFFRRSLRVGGRSRITLGEEIDLASLYLSIEQVRFGSRLSWNIEIDPETRTLSLPPLILQPLVENAVRHGIAGLVDGGTIRIRANAVDDHLVVRLENDHDPDHRATAGEGIGLVNVRGRVEATWQGAATMTVERETSTFAVEIRVPILESEREE